MLTKSNDDQTILTNRTYDITKKLVQLWLPAFSALYFSLAAIWGLPYAEQIVGTIACVTTFLGATLMVSHARYKDADQDVDGVMVVHKNEDRTVMTMELNDEAPVLVNKQTLKFRVRERPLTLDDVDEIDIEEDK